MLIENMLIYNKVRTVPPEALKPIEGGRLKGKSDINPMWRIKTLTDHFGPCGLGWYYEITNQVLEEGANGETAAFVRINLYVKYGEEWSKPIVGSGGSGFIMKEKTGMYTNDECFKMALTDAISVSCKALGVGADVYWDKDRTKYDVTLDEVSTDKPIVDKTEESTDKPIKPISEAQIKRLFAIAIGKSISADKVKEQVKTKFNKEVGALTKTEYDAVCKGYEGLKK